MYSWHREGIVGSLRKEIKLNKRQNSDKWREIRGNYVHNAKENILFYAHPTHCRGQQMPAGT